ncbi:MAG: hypothetical protein AAFV53_24575 [Myxococcota bacterium]
MKSPKMLLSVSVFLATASHAWAEGRTEFRWVEGKHLEVPVFLEGKPVEDTRSQPVVPLSQLRLTPSPEAVFGGDLVEVRLYAEDMEGNGRAGLSLDVTTTSGTLESLTDAGRGLYQARVRIDETATGSIWIVAAAPNDDVVGQCQVQIRSPEEWTSVFPRKPIAPTWLSIYGGSRLGLYGYSQEPAQGSSVLYARSISFGLNGQVGAFTPGIHARARFFFPSRDAFGVDAEYSTTTYQLTFVELDDPVVDWIHDFSIGAVARHTFRSRPAAVSVGLQLGIGLDDFLVYRQIVDGESLRLGYESLNTFSFQPGIEVKADLWFGLFVLAELDVGFAQGTTFYRTDIATTIGYTPPKRRALFLYLRGNQISRQALLYDDNGLESGLVTDSSRMVDLGLGVQFN